MVPQRQEILLSQSRATKVLGSNPIGSRPTVIFHALSRLAVGLGRLSCTWKSVLREFW
jgi:hypothetical protein